MEFTLPGKSCESYHILVGSRSWTAKCCFRIGANHRGEVGISISVDQGTLQCGASDRVISTEMTILEKATGCDELPIRLMPDGSDERDQTPCY